MSHEPLYLDFEESHPLNRYGYQVVRHGQYDQFDELKKAFSQHLLDALLEFCPNAKGAETFTPETYHEFLQNNNIEQHEFIAAIKRTLPKSFNESPFITTMLKVIKEKTGKDFHIYKDKIEFRVVRPNCEDNNRLHRDHWFPYFTPLMNIYVPISGSNCDSAMCVVPFSHKWAEEDVTPTFTYEESASGKKSVRANGVAYSVPEIKESTKEIKPHRPDVMEGDFMLFSPLMVHGGGDNSSLSTRFSLEIRLEVSQ